MSAFVVSDETLNRILAWCELKHLGGSDRTSMDRAVRDFVGSELWRIAPEDNRREPWLTLGHMMHALNVAAVYHRYAHNADALAEKYTYQYGPAHTALRSIAQGFKPVVEDVAVYKLLTCWLYQCSEGKQFEEDPLFVRALALRDHIARALVDRMPEYDKAAWDA